MVARLFRAALATLALAACGFALFLAARPPVAPQLRADAAAVLTGGPGRIEAGFALLARGDVGRVLVSGVHPDATLADLVREARVVAPAPGLVTLGHRARSTRGNAEEIAAWARAQRLVRVAVVTQRMHMPRALLELRRAAPELELLAYPVADPGGTALLRRAAAEYAKLVGALAGLSALAPRREAAAEAGA